MGSCESETMQWKSLKAGEARNMKLLLRKVTGSEGSLPKREAMKAAICSAAREEPLQHFGGDILLARLVQHALYEAKGFNVYSAGLTLPLQDFFLCSHSSLLEYKCLPRAMVHL